MHLRVLQVAVSSYRKIFAISAVHLPAGCLGSFNDGEVDVEAEYPVWPASIRAFLRRVIRLLHKDRIDKVEGCGNVT